MRSATNTEMAKICASSKPAARSDCDVGGCRRVRIAGELAGPAGERPLGAVERRVVAAQHALGDLGAGLAGQLLAPRQRAVRVAEGRGAGGDEDGSLTEGE